MLHIMPRTPGCDFTEVAIEELEPLLGQAVWGTEGNIGFTHDGTHTKYIALPQCTVTSKPANLKGTIL